MFYELNGMKSCFGGNIFICFTFFDLSGVPIILATSHNRSNPGAFQNDASTPFSGSFWISETAA